MVKDVNLLSYWLPFLRNIKEFKEIAKAEEPEIILLLQESERTLNNMYIELADEDGISRFESMMGIIPEEGDTLETRRFAVLIKWSDKLPYTEDALKGLLEVLCGADGYTLKTDYANYELTVKLALYNEDNVNEVKKLLDRVVPANLIQKVLLFNTHYTLSGVTHEQLSAYTYKEVREELF